MSIPLSHVGAFLLVVAALLVASGLGVAPARAACTPSNDVSFGIEPGCYSSGVSGVQGGAHADQVTSFSLNTRTGPSSVFMPVLPFENTKDLVVELPPGFIGNPQAYPKCSEADISSVRGCPVDTQIGVINYGLGGPASIPAFGNLYAPIYNMIPQNGAPAEFAFPNAVIVHPQIHLLASVRSDSDFGVNVTVPHISGILGLLRSKTTFWADPADPSHDEERGACLTSRGPTDERTEEEIEEGAPPRFKQCPSDLPRRPFLSNPSHCGSQEITTLSINSWEKPTDVFSYESEPQAFEGCDQLEFEPTIEAKPSTSLADSPSGLDFHLHIPQNEDPDGLATAHLKNSRVTLPTGLAVNPSSANGLSACSPAQIGLTTAAGDPQAHFTTTPANCPDGSKLGTVSVQTPVLDHPVPGAIYLASQGQNPFGSLLAIYIVLEDDKSNLIVKLPAKLEGDPSRGQLTALVSEAPQLPFEDLRLHFFEGSRAALRTPLACATYATTTDMTPWSSPEGADAFPADSFTIDHGAGGGACVSNEAAAPNKPSFTAGTADPIANAYTPFTLRLARADGTQQLTGIDTTLPKGLIARLAGATYCPETALVAAASHGGRSEQASPSCPASSRVGTVNVAAGAGPTPYHAGATAYLAGPYKGAPLSLAVIAPAVAGPFDLGTVVVRNAVYVNPETAEVRAVSDPFPSILQGIPLDLRSVAVNLDRSRFTRNPTSCDPMSITGTALTLTGQSAALSNPFQVGDCQKLAFKPKLSLRLKGGTKRGDFPALRAVLKARDGDANLAAASVTLPRSIFLEQGHIGTVCTRAQFAADRCPAKSVYGHARAFTPLLDRPLEGPVYLRSSSHKLPDLVIDLHGQLDIALAGQVDSVKGGGIRTRFEAIPDAQVSKFALEMAGGKKGLLQNSRNLCATTYRATVLINGQNGKTADQSPALGNDCKAKGHKKHKHSGR